MDFEAPSASSQSTYDGLMGDRRTTLEKFFVIAQNDAMAAGDSPYDQELTAAWVAFCDRLKAAGERVFKDVNPPTALQRVDGFRYLTQNLSQAFDLALETKDPRFPALYAFCSPTRKLGSDNADCVYLQAWIDGTSVYKLSGKKGSARMWNVTVQAERSPHAYGRNTRILHEPFGDTPRANLFGHELNTNWDGSFELFIGGDKQGQNWLPTTPGTRKLFLRQYFDRWDEEPADYRLERIDMDGPRPLPTINEMVEAMRWSLRADEALILEFDHNDDFWMVTSEGMFGNSMDFAYRNVSYTPSRTTVDGDGRIRLVLSATDPGIANWLDNQGYTSGIITFRNVMAGNIPELRTRVVPVSDLARQLTHSKKITREERIEQLQQRFAAISRRYRI